MAILAAYLSIIGLMLDFLGSAFLAHDALYGREARRQASLRHDRLRHARQNQLEAANPHEQMRAQAEAIAELIDEIQQWERREARVHHFALRGLVLLMIGFAAQGIASVITLRVTTIPVQP